MKSSFTLLLLIIVGVLASSCGSQDPIKASCDSQPVSHEIFDELLKKHVSNSGEVNYKGFIADSVKFNEYFQLLETNHPLRKWTDNERLAYWINAYNAYTIRLIYRNYPVESIKELGGSIYKVNTSWDIKFINICGEIYDINNIEHQKIRGQFAEPRIHFAVNCASVSCPKLLNEAFIAGKLDEQLDRVAKEFINNTAKNRISSEKASLSKIFKWYSGDFEQGKESALGFINKYANTKLTEQTEIEFMDYNWNLNDVGSAE
ncbi:MAG: DUF547 domain-containing protein [Flavobacteriales bacterium]